jgi:hypothetical protein
MQGVWEKQIKPAVNASNFPLASAVVFTALSGVFQEHSRIVREVHTRALGGGAWGVSSF